MVRDIDLALFGVLPPGQLLGGAVPPPAVDGDRDRLDVGAGPVVGVLVPTPVARSAVAAGGLMLRDEESTPLARLELTDPAGQEDGDAGVGGSPDGDVVTGTLHRVRHRESGEARRHTVSDADLWPAAQRAVVVFGRPPVVTDADQVRRALDDSGSVPLAVVPDDPYGEVPTPVMLDVVRLWLEELGVGDRTQIRTAALASRDAASDPALVARLTRALGGSPVLHLAAHDGSPGARSWQAARVLLETGDRLSRSSPPPSEQPSEQPSEASQQPSPLSPAVLARLRRWRPPRSRRGLVLMFSGLSGSGKSTLARDLGEWLATHTDRTVSLLDGDVVRRLLSSGLGFGRAAREMNVARIGYVAAEVARHGGIAICAPIAPYASTREEVRRRVRALGDFVLVHVSTPLEECERRDLKGLYAKARAGVIPEFTGISDPYETPTDAELSVDTSAMPREAALAQVVDYLRRGGWLPDAPPAQQETNQGDPRS